MCTVTQVVSTTRPLTNGLSSVKGPTPASGAGPFTQSEILAQSKS